MTRKTTICMVTSSHAQQLLLSSLTRNGCRWMLDRVCERNPSNNLKMYFRHGHLMKINLPDRCFPFCPRLFFWWSCFWPAPHCFWWWTRLILTLFRASSVAIGWRSLREIRSKISWRWKESPICSTTNDDDVITERNRHVQLVQYEEEQLTEAAQ